MKSKHILPVIAIFAALLIFAAGCASEEPAAGASATPPGTASEPSDKQEQPDKPDGASEQPTAALAEYPVTGPWGLSTVKNDMAELYVVFGTLLRDGGASMEIKSSGEIQYYVGAAGGAGDYTRDGAALTARLTSYAESRDETLELKLVEEDGQVYLTCIVYDTTLWWTQNELEQAGTAGDEAAG